MQIELDIDRLEPGLRTMVRAIQNKPDFPERLARMALVFRKRTDRKDSCHLAQAARSMKPSDPLIRELTDWVVRRHVPRWHFPLVHDQLRNRTYADALARFVEPDMTVLEIGTGTGLLAMLAARAGAGHVYTCEIDPFIAETARQIIANNGLADRITVISGDASEVRVGKELPEKADLFVAEMVDNGLLSEHVLPLTEYARFHLLKPDAILLPHTITAMGALVSGNGYHDRYRLGEVMGFDLSPFNRFSPSSINAGENGRAIDELSETYELIEFDLTKNHPKMTAAQSISMTAHKDGLADGVLRWHRLSFGEEIFFENRPGQSSIWNPRLHLFDQPRAVTRGDKVQIFVMHDRERIVIENAG